jgi:hypothetical protein
MTCKYTDVRIDRECQDGIPCPKEVTNDVCYSDLLRFLPEGAAHVNNWEKDGLWADRKGKWALFSFKANKIEEGKLKGSDYASIIVSGTLPETIENGTVVYGVGKFKQYDQGMFTDDLVISDATLITAKEYAPYDAGAKLFHKIKSYKSDKAEQRFGESVEDLWIMQQEMENTGLLSKQDLALIYFQANKSPSVVQTRASEAKEKRMASAAEEFDSDPFLRLQAIATDWETSEWAWSLPTNSKCGTQPDKGSLSDQEFAARKGEKSALRSQVMATYRKMSIAGYKVEVGKYDTAKKVFPVTLYDSSFSLSGKARSKKVNSSYNQCCELLRPGVFKTPFDRYCTIRIFGCKSNEGLKTFYDSDIEWDEDLQKKTFLVPSDTETAEWTGSLKAEAVVRVTKVTRICSSDSYESPVFTGEIGGVQFLSKGEVIHTEIFTEVTTEEAQMGSEAWVEAKVKGTL